MGPEIRLRAIFLAATLGVTFGSLVSTAPGEDGKQCQTSKVLILGAGMAGVAAGRTLSENGVDDFQIIEFQDRIGGRTLHTDIGAKPDGAPWVVELGTNWITGLHSPNGSVRGDGKFNPIWGLAQDVNLTTALTQVDLQTYNQKGRYDWSNALEEFTKANDKTAKMAGYRVEHNKSDVSMRVGLQLAGWDSTNDMYKQTAEWALWELTAATSVDASSMIFDQIGEAASEGPVLGPYDRLVVDQRGYDLVTRHLAGEYLKKNDTRLNLNSPVTNVSYSEIGVTVDTANGTCYKADYAICTFSLGVLQQAINGQAPVSFSPSFPQWKSESVFGNIMGIYTKIFFQFDPKDVFWPKDIQHYLYASPTNKGYWGVWEPLDFTGSPLEGSGLIFATMIYDQSRRIEQQSDEATKKEGLEVLKQMFPNVTIPEPKAFKYPRWGMTPWSYGSYSNWATGYSLEDHTNFRANLGRLWFAGEATSSEYFGYLHGAYYEGQFAAEEVAACVKNSTQCANRPRSTNLSGDPEGFYNSTNGFQDSTSALFG